MLKRTPLYEEHLRRGARMVDFGGWDMPLQYTSIIEEHLATRERAGLFDVSHMGEIVVRGKAAKAALNRIVTNDLNLIRQYKVIYTLMLNKNGGVVDDLLVYMIDDDEFLLVVNASNTDKDYEWLKGNVAAFSADIEVNNRSADYGLLAVQGPSAQAILQKLAEFEVSGIKPFTFEFATLCGTEAIVSRTGYTGEDGFEIYCDSQHAEAIWNGLFAAGKEEGLQPAGLGARDTLRFESALPLYGHEVSDSISPIEAGLGFFVKLGKGDFLGKDVVEKQAVDGTGRRLAGIELLDRGVPRAGYRVEKDGEDVGFVTSGMHSPTFKKGLAMALLSVNAVQLDNDVDVVIRDKRVKAKIVKLPFYRRRRE